MWVKLCRLLLQHDTSDISYYWNVREIEIGSVVLTTCVHLFLVLSPIAILWKFSHIFLSDHTHRLAERGKHNFSGSKCSGSFLRMHLLSTFFKCHPAYKKSEHKMKHQPLKLDILSMLDHWGPSGLDPITCSAPLILTKMWTYFSTHYFTAPYFS